MFCHITSTNLHDKTDAEILNRDFARGSDPLYRVFKLKFAARLSRIFIGKTIGKTKGGNANVQNKPKSQNYGG